MMELNRLFPQAGPNFQKPQVRCHEMWTGRRIHGLGNPLSEECSASSGGWAKLITGLGKRGQETTEKNMRTIAHVLIESEGPLVAHLMPAAMSILSIPALGAE